MEFKILKNEKNNLILELDSLTVAELLRAYLNKDDAVLFAAWKREHPSKNPVLELETKGKSPRKALQDAIEHVEKDIDKFLDDFKKVK